MGRRQEGIKRRCVEAGGRPGEAGVTKPRTSESSEKEREQSAVSKVAESI